MGGSKYDIRGGSYKGLKSIEVEVALQEKEPEWISKSTKQLDELYQRYLRLLREHGENGSKASASALERALKDYQNAFRKAQENYVIDYVQYFKQIESITEKNKNRLMSKISPAEIEAAPTQEEGLKTRAKQRYENRNKEIDAYEWRTKMNQNGELTEEQKTLIERSRKTVAEAYSKTISEIEAKQKEAEKTALEDLLKEYKDYEARRAAENARFDADRRSLEGAPIDTKEKEAAIAELERKRKASLERINEEEAESLEKTTSLLVELFGEASEKSDVELRKVIKETKELVGYLKQTPAEGLSARFGMTAEQLKALQGSPEKIKAITEQIEKLEEAAKKSNPFRSLGNALKDLWKKSEDGEKGTSLESKLKKVGESAGECAGMIGGIAGKLSEMFAAAGNETLSEMFAGVAQAMETVGNIANGFAQGGVIGGITAAVGEAIGLITQAFQAEARHKAALEEIMKEAEAQQRAYNLALLEENLLLKESETIFGNLDYKKASNAVQVMRESWAELGAAIKGTEEQQKKYEKREGGKTWIERVFNKLYMQSYTELKDAYSGLAEIEIKTGHKKTGLFGWGKGKDLYSSILDVYPELIDASGNFNRTLAESIMSSREFKDEGKEALQYMIDLYDKAEEAEQAVADYLSGIFGDLGNSLAEALTDAFRSGTEAAKAFGESVGEMLETLGEQMIYSAVFGTIIEEANAEMLGVMKNVSLTEEQKFREYIDILGAMTSGILGSQGEYNALLEAYEAMAAESGIELWKPEGTSQSGKAGSFSAMSQDQGTKLEGLFTSGQIHWASMDEELADVAGKMAVAMDHLSGIRENTGASAKRLGEIKAEIERIVRDGIKVK